MIAQHTRGGCPLRTGDLLGTGTLSGPSTEQIGCLLELTRSGTKPFEFAPTDTSKAKALRGFLEDGDTVVFTAQAKSANGNVGFGSCRGVVLPAI